MDKNQCRQNDRNLRWLTWNRLAQNKAKSSQWRNQDWNIWESDALTV